MINLRFYLTAFVVMLCCICVNAQYNTFVKDGIIYKIDIDEVSTDITVFGYTDDMPENVVLPETFTINRKLYNVSSIGPRAFIGCEKLKSIDLGNVKTIESLFDDPFSYGAFQGCTGLTSIDFKNVKTIGETVFAGCTNLASIDLRNVETIGRAAFINCKALTSVNLKNVKNLDFSAFQNCTGITSVDLGNLSSVPGETFDNCSGIVSVNLRNAGSIGGGAFRNCSALTSIDLKNITTIGREAFSGCSALSSVDLSNVRTLGYRAFAGCMGLTGVTMHSIERIEYETFCYCTNLSDVNLQNVNYIDDCAFKGCGNLKQILTYETEPPFLAGKAFDEVVYSSAELFVPSEFTSKYMYHSMWGKFKNITGVKIHNEKYQLNIRCGKGGSVSFNGLSVEDGTVSAEIRKNAWVDICMVPKNGSKLDYVRVNGVDVTSDVKDNLYSFKMMEDTDVEVMFKATSYSLTIRDAERGCVELAADADKAYTFKFNAAEGWRINSVTFNDTDVTGLLDEDNRFTTPAITENSVLNVSFEYTDAAVTEVFGDDVRVRGFYGKLSVEGLANGARVYVFAQDGALVASQVSDGGSMMLAVESGGIYIVRAGNRLFKIAM